MEIKAVHDYCERKKKAGLVNDLVSGIGMLIITVIITLVIVSTLLGASLLTAGSEYANASTRMATNFTAGIDNISGKLPTILLIAAVVLLFGVLVFLVAYARKMQLGGTSSL